MDHARSRCGFQIHVRVYHEDTDAGGIVYYANYLKYMERARTELLRSAGFEQNMLMHDHNRLFVVANATLNYLRPARFDDMLTVSAIPQRHGRASVVFEQTVRSTSSANRHVNTSGSIASDPKEAVSGNPTNCEATVTLACVDRVSFRPARMPDDLLRAISGLTELPERDNSRNL